MVESGQCVPWTRICHRFGFVCRAEQLHGGERQGQYFELLSRLAQFESPTPEPTREATFWALSILKQYVRFVRYDSGF